MLYKYVDLCTGMKIIKEPSLKFTHPYRLNDPFEITSSFYEDDSRDYSGEENSFNHHKLVISYGVLSLSRSPLNALMWAHYARGNKQASGKFIDFSENNENHGGLVIGIDAEEAGLNGGAHNVIPAKFGSVIYTSTKPTSIYSDSEKKEITEGMLTYFNINYMEALQRIFLYKPLDWSYEEEVRVVRNIGRAHQEEHRKEIQPIEKNSIKEIYIGSLHGTPRESAGVIYNKINKYLPNCQVFLCNTKTKDWKINAELLEK